MNGREVPKFNYEDVYGKVWCCSAGKRIIIIRRSQNINTNSYINHFLFLSISNVSAVYNMSHQKPYSQYKNKIQPYNLPYIHISYYQEVIKAKSTTTYTCNVMARKQNGRKG